MSKTKHSDTVVRLISQIRGHIRSQSTAESLCKLELRKIRDALRDAAHLATQVTLLKRQVEILMQQEQLAGTGPTGMEILRKLRMKLHTDRATDYATARRMMDEAVAMINRELN
jgi:hypothetical protein